MQLQVFLASTNENAVTKLHLALFRVKYIFWAEEKSTIYVLSSSS